jgi:hypothetical protein
MVSRKVAIKLRSSGLGSPISSLSELSRSSTNSCAEDIGTLLIAEPILMSEGGEGVDW